MNKNQTKTKPTNQNQVQNYYFITILTNVPFLCVFVCLYLSFTCGILLTCMVYVDIYFVSNWFVIEEHLMTFKSYLKQVFTNMNRLIHLSKLQLNSFKHCANRRSTHYLRGKLFHITKHFDWNDLCKSLALLTLHIVDNDRYWISMRSLWILLSHDLSINRSIYWPIKFTNECAKKTSV